METSGTGQPVSGNDSPIDIVDQWQLIKTLNHFSDWREYLLAGAAFTHMD